MEASLVRIEVVPGSSLKDFVPADPYDFCVTLVLVIGPKGTKVEELFNVYVCTPKWIESALARTNEYSMWGFHHLIVARFDQDEIASTIRRYVEQLDSKSWSEIVAKIRLVGEWEYEDYVDGES